MWKEPLRYTIYNSALIGELLNRDDPNTITQALEEHLAALNQEMYLFREQQGAAFDLLGQAHYLTQTC